MIHQSYSLNVLSLNIVCGYCLFMKFFLLVLRNRELVPRKCNCCFHVFVKDLANMHPSLLLLLVAVNVIFWWLIQKLSRYSYTDYRSSCINKHVNYLLFARILYYWDHSIKSYLYYTNFILRWWKWPWASPCGICWARNVDSCCFWRCFCFSTCWFYFSCMVLSIKLCQPAFTAKIALAHIFCTVCLHCRLFEL